ncbi:hypothetical protein K438DRAFT_2116438 [Mycena galopus ATCC 62051]|nr:hypothetical protein K438DRAFT_2116438 [Mycena galopus ATCC 62051]
MPRGKVSKLPQEKLDYLESHWTGFLEKKTNRTSFWSKVEKGWFAKWPVETTLGLPVIDTTASIEASALSDAQKTEIGAAQSKISGVRAAVSLLGSGLDTQILRQQIRSWYNNKNQKEKRILNSEGSAAVTSQVKELLATVSRRRTRKLQKEEVWEKRHPDELMDAMKEDGFQEMMGVSEDDETMEERKERISNGRKAQLKLRKKTRARLFQEASTEEQNIVEEIYANQKTEKSVKPGKAETPEDFQQGLNMLPPLVKQFHEVIHDLTGWVGSTLLVGPVPEEEGKIGTQSGQTLDQAHIGWDDHVIKPLQQFGKAVFDHDTRRARALHREESEEPEGGADDEAEDRTPKPPRRRNRKKKQKSKVAVPSSNAPAIDTDSLLPFETDPQTTIEDHALGFDPDLSPPDGEWDSDSRLETAAPPSPSLSVMDMDVIDPALREDRLSRTDDPEVALISSNDPPPLPTLGMPLFEIRPISADSPSQGGLAPFTTGFHFTANLGPSTPVGSASAAVSQRPSPTTPPKFRPRAFGFGPSASPATPRSLSLVLSPSTLQNLQTTQNTTVPPAVPSASAARGTPPPLSTPVPRGTPSARGAPAARGISTFSVARTPSGTVTTPSPLRIVHTAPAGGAFPPIPSLTHDNFPHSRPMSNPPSRPKPAGRDGGLEGVSGAGSARGGQGGARGGGRGGRGGGRGGRGGGRGGGVVHEGREGGGGEEGGGGKEGGGGDQVHTVELVSRQRMLEIREFEKKRDALAAQAAKDRDRGIFRFPPPPAGHEALPQGPAALGVRRVEVPIKLASRPPPLPLPPRAPSTRDRRLPGHLDEFKDERVKSKKRTMTEIKTAAAAKRIITGKGTTKAGAKGKAKAKEDGEKGKRKATENLDVDAGVRPTKNTRSALRPFLERGSLGYLKPLSKSNFQGRNFKPSAPPRSLTMQVRSSLNLVLATYRRDLWTGECLRISRERERGRGGSAAGREPVSGREQGGKRGSQHQTGRAQQAQDERGVGEQRLSPSRGPSWEGGGRRQRRAPRGSRRLERATNKIVVPVAVAMAHGGSRGNEGGRIPGLE